MKRELELIIKSLELINEGFRNIYSARSEWNINVIEAINDCINNLETLDEEADL